MHSDGAHVLGFNSPVVPASSLLCHLLTHARDFIGFGTTNRAGTIRFLRPVKHGEEVLVHSSVGEIDLLRPDGTYLATGSFHEALEAELSLDRYPVFHGSRRPLTSNGLASEDRMGTYVVACERTSIESFLASCGMDALPTAVPTSFLISTFVPYLANNFERRGPSLYTKVSILSEAPVEYGDRLEIRGRIADVYEHNNRETVDIETIWIGEDRAVRLWARHTLAYGFGQNRQTEPIARRKDGQE